ncbi:hypothetical protein H0H92_005188 [Tricholoma furcatifolium]|nr:hypothetical protein H0H92_005188 [Tricholoma furcatifolium]
MFLARHVALLTASVLAFQAAAASKNGFTAHRMIHHRHHFKHQSRPATSQETAIGPDTTSTSSATRSTLSTTRFATSTTQTDSAELLPSTTSLSLQSDVIDPSGVSTTNALSTSDPALPTRASSPSLTPNGIKAGIAGGDAYPFFKDHIGWWYDWTPNPSKSGKPIGVPMLWGSGTVDPTDAARLAAFKKITSTPPYVLAYEEPDCPPGSGSAGMSVSAGVSEWERLIVPLGKKGSLMGSPSMCKQADETWLAQFGSEISTPWNFTSVHINKNDINGVKKDIEHYWNTYNKPIWVTEFACVNGQTI